MSVTPPEELTYGKVVGRFLLSVADTTDDPDRVPDARAAQGLTVTLTPKTVVQRVEGASPVTVLRSSTTCTVGADGWLHDPAGAAGVWLVTGVYTVSYKATGLAGFSLPSQHTIEVTAEHTDEAPLDLTTALPYTPPAGVTVQTVQLPTGASAGKVLGWTASGAAWVTPDEAGAHTHEPEEVTGLAAVASSGSYNDLTDTPSIPATASDVGAADAEHTHPAEDITGLATVATSGDYDDLENKPSIPSTPGDIGAAAASHSHTADHISDATNVGKDVLTAADAAAARSAIGAGTSSLSIGTTDSTAAAGNRGLPTGGTEGQVLAKASGSNYDTEWVDPPEGGGGGGGVPLVASTAVGKWFTYPLFMSMDENVYIRANKDMPLIITEAMSIDAVTMTVGTAPSEATVAEINLLDASRTFVQKVCDLPIPTATGDVTAVFTPVALSPGVYHLETVGVGYGEAGNFGAKFTCGKVIGWDAGQGLSAPYTESPNFPRRLASEAFSPVTPMIWVRRSA